MSLATTSGMAQGGGGGGVVMAHRANAMARAAPKPPPVQATSTHGTGPPPLVGAAHDKQQGISLKQVRTTSHLPIVAVDLFASEPTIALFPAKGDDPSEPVAPVLVGKVKSRVALNATEASHKTLRKYLTKQKPYKALLAESLSHAGAKGDDEVVVIEKPQQWLGLRRLEDAPDVVKKGSHIASEDATPAIAEEATQDVGVTVTNSTLDGSVPQGDDFDRVVCKVRVHSSKKALTVLPEEATQILLHQAQYHVAHKLKIDVDDEEAEVLDFPCAIALPAYASYDAAVEALLDATSSTGVIYQRSVCALTGALELKPDGSPNELLKGIQQVRAARLKEFKVRQVEEPDATFEDDILLVLLGMTSDGLECTAVQVSSPQENNPTCPFGVLNVLSNISYQAEAPVSKLEQCTREMKAALEVIVPESDGPDMLVLYGSTVEQKKMEHAWETCKSKLGAWAKRAVLRTKPDCIAMGTAILGAVSHGRQTVIVPEGKKTKAIFAIRVQNVAPVAVGVQMNYFGGKAKKWEPVKTIFDFDRRIPAGPYVIDLKASECVVLRQGGAADMSDEDFLKATKEVEGAKGIPKREEAALNLRVQIVQKWTRDGDWINVGDVMEPLVEASGDGDEKEKVACEQIALELSLGVTGMITTNLVGERESVVQATKSARNSTLRYYIGILLAILFFGGFLVKSYWEEYVFERDTERLLAYYKHVIPGSMHDGDRDSARYLVWKYRGKKAKLWRQLEKKYDVPVRQVNEWDDYKSEESSNVHEEEEETADLDNEEEQGEDQHEPRKEAPDL